MVDILTHYFFFYFIFGIVKIYKITQFSVSIIQWTPKEISELKLQESSGKENENKIINVFGISCPLR